MRRPQAASDAVDAAATPAKAYPTPRRARKARDAAHRLREKVSWIYPDGTRPAQPKMIYAYTRAELEENAEAFKREHPDYDFTKGKRAKRRTV